MDFIPLTNQTLRKMELPAIREHGGKEERGRVLVVAGSRELPGAALLCGTAALRAGAGKLQIATASSVAQQLGTAVPEARVISLQETDSGAFTREAAEVLLPYVRHCDALLLGPGLMDREAAGALAGELLRRCSDVPAVIDASAMMKVRDHVEALSKRRVATILTPHPGEMAGILGIDKQQVEEASAALARKLAAELQSYVVLKSRITWIVCPTGRIWRHDGGSVGLATSGSGDVLAGLMTGLLARGADAASAAAWAVAVHAEVGARLSQQIGPVGYLARDLLPEIPKIMLDLSRGQGLSS